MNKKIIFALGIIISTVVFISSCKKKEIISDLPTLTFYSPTSGQTFSSGTIHIMGKATAPGSDDAHALHELLITVKKSSDNTEVLSWFIDVHDEHSHDIDTTFTVSGLTGSTNMVLDGLVENHMGKEGSQSVSFTVTP